MHTPGEWVTPGTDGGDRLICYTDTSRGRAKRRTLAHVYGRTIQERDANARLIAAAPKLLEALTGLLVAARVQRAHDRSRGLRRAEDWTALIEGGEAAIAAAEGEEG